jgi:hypothetical protein
MKPESSSPCLQKSATGPYPEPDESSSYHCDWLRAGRSDDRGSIPGRGWEYFSSSLCPDRLWGPPRFLSNGNRGALSVGVKRLGCETDSSPPSSSEVKECVEIYLHSPIRLHGVVLSSAQGLYLYFYHISWRSILIFSSHLRPRLPKKSWRKTFREYTIWKTYNKNSPTHSYPANIR